MVVVHIEMWPQGDESRKYPLAVVAIANVGSNGEGHYDYRYAVSHQLNTRLAKGKSANPIKLLERPGRHAWKSGVLEKFKSGLGVVQLLRKVLIAAYGKE